MLDDRVVQDIATYMSYPETGLWVQKHRHEYSKDIFRGFVAEE